MIQTRKKKGLFLKTACEHDYDFVAISFARNAEDINNVRKVLDENGGKDIQIVTKVENVEGLQNLDTIINFVFSISL